MWAGEWVDREPFCVCARGGGGTAYLLCSLQGVTNPSGSAIQGYRKWLWAHPDLPLTSIFLISSLGKPPRPSAWQGLGARLWAWWLFLTADSSSSSSLKLPASSPHLGFCSFSVCLQSGAPSPSSPLHSHPEEQHTASFPFEAMVLSCLYMWISWRALEKRLILKPHPLESDSISLGHPGHHWCKNLGGDSNVPSEVQAMALRVPAA